MGSKLLQLMPSLNGEQLPSLRPLSAAAPGPHASPRHGQDSHMPLAVYATCHTTSETAAPGTRTFCSSVALLGGRKSGADAMRASSAGGVATSTSARQAAAAAR